MITLYRAEEIAGQLREAMEPYCEKVQIAGSVRRQKANVKDIEIVAIPSWDERPNPGSLFGELIRTNLLFEEWSHRAGIEWLKGHQPEGEYWQGLLPEGPVLDLFLGTPDTWGLDLLIRTGCWEYSRAVMAWADVQDFPCRKGALRGRDRDRRPLSTPTEASVFALLDLPQLDPERRDPAAADRLWDRIKAMRKAA